MEVPESITNKQLFDAIKAVETRYRALAKGNCELYPDEFIRGVTMAMERLQFELGFYPQLLIKDRDY